MSDDDLAALRAEVELHGEGHRVLWDCHNRLVGRVEAPEATIERQGEAIRAFGADCAEYVAQSGEIPSGPFHRLAALDAPAPDAAPEPMPDCPRCGNNRQVWRNQISGRPRCHRVGCEADLPAPPADAPALTTPVPTPSYTTGVMNCATPPPPALPGPVADAVEALRGVGAHYTADDLEAWARAQQQPALDADAGEMMLVHYGPIPGLAAPCGDTTGKRTVWEQCVTCPACLHAMAGES